MGSNDHIDLELYELVEDAADEGYLERETAAYGIAQKVIHEGYESLSQKQRYVYDTIVVPALEKRGEDLDIQRIKDTD
jgi:hypothetical protein